MKNQKYIISTFLGAAALVGFAVRGLLSPLLARFEIGDPELLGFINGTSLMGIVVGVVVFFTLNRNRSAYAFTDEAVAELRKVTWPDKDDTVRSTAVVVGTTLFIALTLAAYDFAWARVTSVFLFTGG